MPPQRAEAPMDWMNPRGGWAPPRRSAPPALGLSCPRSRGRCGSARRAGFRFLWGNPWGFESPLPHQPQNPCFQGLACEHTETGASRHVIWRHGFGIRRGTRRGTRFPALDVAKGAGVCADRLATHPAPECTRLGNCGRMTRTPRRGLGAPQQAPSGPSVHSQHRGATTFGGGQ